MDCFLAKNGGCARLNFRVVGNPQPATPKENVIWVNTDVPIGAWYFDANRPDDLQEGDVWFSVGTSSPVEFNALRKNGIQIYPQSAKQYVGGAWLDKLAYSYQGGEWVEWITYLFLDGNEYASLTGGWQRGRNLGTGGTIELGDTIVITSNSGNGSDGSVVSATQKNPINLSDANTIFADFWRISGAEMNAGIVISTDAACNNIVASTSEMALSDYVLTQSLDVSELSGEYYIHIQIAGNERQSSAISAANSIRFG